MNTSKPTQGFSVIGCGRLGISLAVFLAREGFEPRAFASKTRESAEHAAELAGGGRVCDDPVEAAQAADLVFITTPDTAIEEVCSAIADQGGFTDQSLVYHLSGALSSCVLSSARKRGASTGSIHPLQAFAPYTPGQSSPFKGINISIEGDERATALGKEIVNALKAVFFLIPTEAKTLYHASAVVASNYLVTLEHFALSLLAEAGLEADRGYEILEPLILGTLKNIKARGCVNGLTGPVARGDEEIIERHLGDIDRKMPQFAELYRLLGQHTLDITRERGELDADHLERLKQLFNT